MAPEAERTVERDGLRLAVREWAGPAGPDPGGRGLLLIHGLASTSHIFDFVAPLLAPDLHVVAYDQRGHGRSGKPDSGYGFAPLVDDALAVMEATGLRRPIVVGHSWGANVALECTVRRPEMVAGAILVDGAVVSIRRWLDWPSAREMLAPPRMDGVTLTAFLERARQHIPGMLPGPRAEAFVRSLVRVRSDGTIQPRLSRPNHLRILRALWRQEPLDLLRRVRVPTLVLVVRDQGPLGPGPLAGVKEAAVADARGIGPPVRVEWIDGIHDVPLQRPRALANRIRAFARAIQA